MYTQTYSLKEWKNDCNHKHLENAQVFFSMELIKLAMVHEHEQLQANESL